MNRLHTIDCLRGLLIVLMIISHSETVFSGKLGFALFSYVSEAEGFVFLSGLIAGIMFTSRGTPEGGVFQGTGRRIMRLYLFHAGLLAIIGTLFATLSFIGIAGIENIAAYGFQPLIDFPAQFLLAGAALLHQPKYLDILPIFFFTTLITPFLLRGFAKGRAGLIFLSSATIWMVAQILPLWEDMLQSITGLAFLRFSFADLMAWQALFVLSVFAGFNHAALKPVLLSRGFILACFGLCALCFALRWIEIAPKFGLHDIPLAWLGDHPVFLWLTDKTNLGPLRLANFLALSILVWKIFSAFGDAIPQPKVLSAIGRFSLETFAYHILAVYLFFFVRGAVGYYGVENIALRSIIDSAEIALIMGGAALIAFILQRRGLSSRSVGKNTRQ